MSQNNGLYGKSRRAAIDDFERRFVHELLNSCEGNVSKAARVAGMDRVYLHRLIRRHAPVALELTEAGVEAIRGEP